MSQKRYFHNINYSPPTKTRVLFEEEIDEDEVEEDIDDAHLQLSNDLQTLNDIETFNTMKETIKKSSEGALAEKTVSDYKRYDIYNTLLL